MIVGVIVLVELGGWLVYRSVHHGPTALELTEKCLRREKLLTIESLDGDTIAESARGGALATRVEGNGVHLAIATSDSEAAELAKEYLRTAGRQIDLRLDVHGRVLYVWEAPAAADGVATSDDVRLLVRVRLGASLRSPVVTAVLFTCAGQRVDIVSAFGRAGATTVAADLDALAPALYHADHRALVPPVRDPGYVDSLAALVAEHDVRLVVPLTDLDQEIVSAARTALEPALVLAPSAEVCRAMGDKYLAHVFFEEHGIPSPRSWLPDEVPDDARFPLLVKVREGFGSRHIYRADDAEQLAFHLRTTPVESMVQERCLGAEFSVDVFCDVDGRCLNAIPRSMIQSKGGESIKGRSLADRELVEHGARVAETIGIVGPANIQCFREPDGTLPVTDVNPRFGGAFPLPLAAGSRYPELALALARGERPEPRLGEFREGVVMTRFFSDLCLVEDGNGELVPFAEELPQPVAVEPGTVE